jgi:hypothetical protein
VASFMCEPETQQPGTASDYEIVGTPIAPRIVPLLSTEVTKIERLSTDRGAR